MTLALTIPALMENPRPLLLIVDEVFSARGNGTFIAGHPEMPVDLVQEGQRIELETPGGLCLASSIRRIETFVYPHPTPDQPPTPIGLWIPHVRSAQLIVGTKVYLTRESTAP